MLKFNESVENSNECNSHDISHALHCSQANGHEGSESKSSGEKSSGALHDDPLLVDYSNESSVVLIVFLVIEHVAGIHGHVVLQNKSGVSICS